MKFFSSFAPSPATEFTRSRRQRSLLLAVIVIAVLPLVWRGVSCGQDFDFHLQNWLDVVAHWRHGILYPHWSASANYLAGEPRFIFYPPLSWIAGALLGLILPWSWTPLAFALLTLLGAGFSFRAMAREWLSGPNATLVACLYVVNPYMLFVLYERGALAELLAAVWIPLLVLFALRSKPSFLLLTLTIAALWLTNAPAAVMGCYMLAVLVAIAALQHKTTPRESLRLIARSVAAAALGLGLAGFWLIPAAYEERWVQIHRAIGPLMRVQDSFLFGYVRYAGPSSDERFATLYHNQVLHTVSWIVVALIVAAGCPIAARLWRMWVSRRGAKEMNAAPLFWPLTLLAALIVLLQFPVSDSLWRYIPELRYLQFPWRWMLVLGFAAALLAGLAIRHEPATRRALSIRALVLLVFAGGMTLLASSFFWQPCDDEDNIAAQIAAFHATGFEGTDEYTPQGADNADIPSGLPPILVVASAQAELPTPDNPVANPQAVPAAITIACWTPEFYSAAINPSRPAFAVFRLMDYPAWRITLNGAPLRNPPFRTDGLLAIPLAPGPNQISVRWHITPDQAAGLALTLLALAITLAIAIVQRRSTAP